MRASTIAISIIALLTAAGAAWPEECGAVPQQVLKPVNLWSEQSMSCQELSCILSLVDEIDGEVLAITAEPLGQSLTYWVRFSARSSTISGFSVVITSQEGLDKPDWTDAIWLRNWESGMLEGRPSHTSSFSNWLETTYADVPCAEAPRYVSPSGEIELKVVVTTLSPLAGASDKWLEQVEIEIPPPM